MTIKGKGPEEPELTFTWLAAAVVVFALQLAVILGLIKLSAWLLN